jgi:hypothetical protein
MIDVEKTHRRLPFLLALSLSAQGAQVVASLVVARLALHHLGTSDAAFWYLIMGAIPFIILFDFGVGPTSAREVAFERVRGGDAQEVDDLALTCIGTLLASGLVLLFLACAGAGGALATGLLSSYRALCVITFGVGSVIKLLANGAQGLLIGLNMIGTERVIRTTGSVTFCIFAGLGLGYGLGIEGFCLAWLAQAIICFILAIIVVAKSGVSLASGRWRWDIVRRLREPLTQYALSAVPGLFIFNVALYFVASLLDANSVIALSLMLQIVTGLNLLAVMPPSILTTSWSTLWATSRLEELQRSGRQCLGLISTGLSAVIAVIAVHTALVSHVVFGKPVLVAGLFSSLYLAVSLFEGLGNCMTALALSTGFVRFAVITWSSAVGVLLLTWPMTWLFGLAGVPLAILIAQSLTCYQRNPRVALSRLDVPGREVWLWVATAVGPSMLQLLLQGALSRAHFLGHLPPAWRLGVFCASGALLGLLLLPVFMRFKVTVQPNKVIP